MAHNPAKRKRGGRMGQASFPSKHTAPGRGGTLLFSNIFRPIDQHTTGNALDTRYVFPFSFFFFGGGGLISNNAL